jgi:hypothetical protein
VILRELLEGGIKVAKPQIVNKWKSLKKRYKEVNDHNSKSGSNRLDWKHSDAFDRVYGNKASTKVSATFDTGRPQKRKIMESDETEENKEDEEGVKHKKSDQNIKKKKLPKDSLLQRIEQQNCQLLTQMKDQHKEKMNRMDRMLDLFEASLKKNQ